eukprot:TRINITY_DN2783_c0_g1_i2.p1 TRINITY_DN2783_c0_g1~~TRINITY_DN2783_c0_g1_i2.p1  ORF type:complete len:506 (-),score=165.76 TRINITY_DN2783_c0_g1_i2:494-2011(-)
MTDFIDNTEKFESAVQNAKNNNIYLPTYEQLKNPKLIPDSIKQRLTELGVWDIDPANLFRISWYNEAKLQGSLYNELPNYVELPEIITGVKARIVVMFGKYFPTGAHKVGACFGPLVSRLCTGNLDPHTEFPLWPSTGNYARGGAFNSTIMGIKPIVVLPQEMSQERFDWLEKIGAEVHATPGCESNVKEVFDKTKELAADPKIISCNQFEDFSNPTWHYYCTGDALKSIYDALADENDRFASCFFTSGSAGTMAAGDYIKKFHPTMKLVCGEALQCPTILNNGFGGHRIEGIGDKHIPWIHNVKSTDAAAAIDDEDTYRILRLFNTPEGHEVLREAGVKEEVINVLENFGISSIANLLGAIKTAKYFEMNEHDFIMTVATDSALMYQSRLKEMQEKDGDFTKYQALFNYQYSLLGQKEDNFIDLHYRQRKRVHHLKYYTWVEQQDKAVEELNEQWYNNNYFIDRFEEYKNYEKYIVYFNKQTGLMEENEDEYQKQEYEKYFGTQ